LRFLLWADHRNPHWTKKARLCYDFGAVQSDSTRDYHGNWGKEVRPSRSAGLIDMANHASAIKRNRQNQKRRIYNRQYRNRTRTYIKQARKAIKSGDAAQAEEATRTAIRDLDMAASRGIIHPRNAARRKSRLMKQLNAASS
jgi:small subunit ribosomal protein S20